MAATQQSYNLVGTGEPTRIQALKVTAGFFPASAKTPLALETGGTPRDQRNLFVVARLKPDVSAEEASAEMATIARRLEAEFPDTNEGWIARVETLRDNLMSAASLALMVLYGSITFVLLIA